MFLRRALQRFPRMAEAHYFAGIAARARADYARAESEFRESLRLQPRNVDTLAQLGFIVGERDRYAEAEKLLRAAIAINDQHFYANYDLGRLLVKSKRYEDSLADTPACRNSQTQKRQRSLPNIYCPVAVEAQRRSADVNWQSSISSMKSAKPSRDRATTPTSKTLTHLASAASDSVGQTLAVEYYALAKPRS